jgi:type IV pilus assembly protein PilC
MAKYTYTAVSDAGEAQKGVIEADHLTDARVALADRGLYGIEVAAKPSIWKTELTKKKVPRSELMNFSRQLSAFVRAGIPIIDAIEILRVETGNDQFRAVLADVAEALRNGEPFAEAVSTHPEAFPSFYVTILRSAEMTGHIDEVLEQLASYIERDENARRKIKQALTYPLVVIMFALVAVVVLVAFALPRFQTFFDSLDAKLPLVTRMLISITNFLTNYWWALALGFVLFFLVTFVYFRTDRGRHSRDRFLIRAPVIGELVRFTIVERFCRILGSMIGAGVQVPDAMAVAAGGTNNLIYQEALVEARDKMMRGEGMSEPITVTGLFPGGVCQMIRVGEETGTLDDQLEVAANFYSKEVEYKLDRLTSLFEPVLLLVVGIVVGFVAIALVSAMYGIFNQVKVK